MSNPIASDSQETNQVTAAKFLFVTCQVGAERALKGEMARRWPTFRFAYSRPGFLTFKLPSDHGLADDFSLHLVFARAYGFSLGQVKGQDSDELARQVRQLAGGQAYDRLHVWPRDTVPAGDHGFEPRRNLQTLEAAEAIRRSWIRRGGGAIDDLSPTRPGHLVLDVVLISPSEWWVGCHRARSTVSCWPGGFSEVAMPSEAVSRAWLKMDEALRWSRMPLKAGDRVAEIGCAPGGSCQALLDRGLQVTGIDPAAVDPVVLKHPNFVHIRKRGSDVRRREFRKIHWLAIDMNVAPDYTLDTLEAIVTYPHVRIRGLLITLKLLDWSLAEKVPEYLDRIRGWGFPLLRARQLHHNRQEITVAALKKRPRRKKAEQSATKEGNVAQPPVEHAQRLLESERHQSHRPQGS